MSSSSLCQGFQSFVEPVLTEPCVLRLKLAPPTSIFTPSIADNPKTESETIGEDDDDVKSPKCGWSFLQLLTNSPSDRKTKEDDDNNEIDKVYVHPMVKRSSSALCEKSLEMCTESLGSETGSDLSETGDELPLVSSLEPSRQVSKSMGISFGRRRDNRRNVVDYPPPLTSVSGSTGVQVRSHREGGRLVLEAVTVSSSRTYFHAERSNGRLRLSLLKNCSNDIQPEEVEVEEEEVEEEENETFDQEEEEEEENEVVDDVDQNDGGETEEEEEEEDIEGNKEKVRSENGEEKLRRPSRCKEGGRDNKGLIINNYYWEQFWVAT